MCGLRTDATIVCWGSNRDGQAEAPGGTFKSVSTGGSHACGVRTDATIVCWGINELGQTEAPGGDFQVGLHRLDACVWGAY